MKQESRNLVKHRLRRARETLLDAQKYFKGATLTSTVNRIYYAMFYAVNGLLVSRGLSSLEQKLSYSLPSSQIPSTSFIMIISSLSILFRDGSLVTNALAPANIDEAT